MADRPVIVKKKRKSAEGHHGGAWKVAYADFVTAMMAFFLVMWIVGLNTAVKEAIAAYFKDPIGFMESTERGDRPFSLQTPGVLTAPDVKPDLRKDSLELAKARDREQKKFEKVKESLEKVIREYPEFKDLQKSVQVKLAVDGLRIDLIESSSDLFFDSGSALTKPRTRKLLQKIAKELGRLPNSVVVEGHTDSRPYFGPQGWTNWELSTARANAARAIMEVSGLRKGQVAEVRGWADRMPLDPKNRASFRNRRVSIMLKFGTPIPLAPHVP